MSSSISFADYDHENERFVDLYVDGAKLIVSRELQFNADYAPDADPPEEWSETTTLEFGNDAELRGFLLSLGRELIQNCFSVFDHRNSQLDGEEAEDALTDWVDALPRTSESTADAAPPNEVARLCSFPR